MLRIDYDKKADVAYIRLVRKIEPGSIKETYACDPQQVRGQIQLDFDAEGRLVGIEVLDASHLLPREAPVNPFSVVRDVCYAAETMPRNSAEIGVWKEPGVTVVSAQERR